MSEFEAGDEMGSTDDVVGVNKTERAILEGRDGLYSIQPLRFPPSSVGLVDLEPTDPKNIHPGLVRHRWPVENIKSEDSEHPCIRVRMNTIL